MIVNNSVYLKIPTLEELEFTRQLLNDKDTMAFNEKWGGTVDFPKEKWLSFYQEFIENKDRFYFHVYNLDSTPIGEISSRFDKTFKAYVLNIKIMHKYRGNNHAKDALDAFLDYIFLDQEIDRIVDNVGHDSLAGIRLLQSFGFLEIDRTQDYVLLELKKENYY